mmetsp:Transcript_49365/g.127264  ORF Transcript_49365/g.127264 Transcript_49365/m.127264 type:complete len:372 (-) Transcript_49365:664-1779(-)
MGVFELVVRDLPWGQVHSENEQVANPLHKHGTGRNHRAMIVDQGHAEVHVTVHGHFELLMGKVAPGPKEVSGQGGDSLRQHFHHIVFVHVFKGKCKHLHHQVVLHQMFRSLFICPRGAPRLHLANEFCRERVLWRQKSAHVGNEKTLRLFGERQVVLHGGHDFFPLEGTQGRHAPRALNEVLDQPAKVGGCCLRQQPLVNLRGNLLHIRRKGFDPSLEDFKYLKCQFPVVIAQESRESAEHIVKVFGEVLSGDDFFHHRTAPRVRKKRLYLLRARLSVSAQSSRQAVAHGIRVPPGNANGERHDQGMHAEELTAARTFVEGSAFHALPQTRVGAGKNGIHVALATQVLPLFLSTAHRSDDTKFFPALQKER